MKRKSFLVQSLLLVCSYLVACSESPAPGVDRVFVGGTIYTLNESQPWAEALAVDGDEIVYVGAAEGALALSGSKTVQHDLDGKMLLSGFIDTHMHPSRRRLTCQSPYGAGNAGLLAIISPYSGCSGC
tara:strand:- start:80 stop:463 length:384 start_codon:yes stop_codon:yes gene_type:complete